MTTSPNRSSQQRRRDGSRLLIGLLLELGITAYGASAALSVALSDAETVGAKSQVALAAVPSLTERYRAAKYVVNHRQEIQAAAKYVQQHTLSQAELEEAVDRTSETIHGIDKTYSELEHVGDAFGEFPPRPDEALGHASAAWGAMPDQESIRDLSATANEILPYLDQVEVLIPVYRKGLLTVADNFASDEIAATLGVMAVAFGLAFVLGQAVGFWARRGRPGFLGRKLQRWGAGRFRGWYVDNLRYALSPPLFDAARERIQRDIVADPEGQLDPEALRKLESYFKGRPKDVFTP